MNLDIYLGISYGQYSNHNKDNEALFEPYSDKEMRSYNPSLGGFDLHYSTNTSMGWTFIEVSLYAFANGVQIGEPKFMPPIEAGYCPSVNLIDTGEQSLLKVIPAVEQFVADNTSAITKFAEDKHAEAITFLKDTLEKIS